MENNIRKTTITLIKMASNKITFTDQRNDVVVSSTWRTKLFCTCTVYV